MRRSTRLAPILVLLLVATVAAPALLLANHAWGNYHWARQANPFTLKVGDNVNSTWDPYLDEAIADWNPSTVLNLTEVAGTQRPRNCKGTTGRVEVCNASYGNTGWLGIAGISVQGSHITKGYVKLNDTYFGGAPYNTPAWRRMVTCQEIGHTFGLDHQDENFDNGNLGTCMDYTSDPDGPPSNEHPDNHDFDQLETIYAHLDSTTTVGATFGPSAPPAMEQLGYDGEGSWGRLVARTRDGGQEVYELDFGGGHKQFTFVIWTLEEAARRRAPEVAFE